LETLKAPQLKDTGIKAGGVQMILGKVEIVLETAPLTLHTIALEVQDSVTKASEENR